MNFHDVKYASKPSTRNNVNIYKNKNKKNQTHYYKIMLLRLFVNIAIEQLEHSEFRELTYIFEKKNLSLVTLSGIRSQQVFFWNFPQNVA